MQFASLMSAAIIGGMLLSGTSAIAQTTLRLAENQPDDNPVTMAMRRFAELVQEKTNGEVVVEVYASAQLGQEPETIEQAQAGIIDLTRVNTVGLANVSPSMGVVTLPYIFTDREQKYAVLDGEIGQELREDLKEVGLIAFDFMEAGTRHFYTRTPVESIEDLAGLQIRVQPAPIATRMVELIGASPTPMNYGEVYSALQTGVIDGAENDYVSFHTSSHYEVAKYLIEDGHLSPPAILLMNQARFESLPEEHQQAITEAAHEAAIWQRDAMYEANEEAKRIVMEAGVTVIETDPAPFQKAVQPLYEEYDQLLPLVERIQAMD